MGMYNFSYIPKNLCFSSKTTPFGKEPFFKLHNISLKIIAKNIFPYSKKSVTISITDLTELRGPDLNQRPSGYEPDELPGCSTPR